MLSTSSLVFLECIGYNFIFKTFGWNPMKSIILINLTCEGEFVPYIISKALYIFIHKNKE